MTLYAEAETDCSPARLPQHPAHRTTPLQLRAQQIPHAPPATLCAPWLGL